jgi:hypothetical protein
VGAAVIAWSFPALVVRYGVPIDGKVLAPGCFRRTTAQWFVPLMHSHAKHYRRGVAHDYDDSDRGLIIDFATRDELLVEEIFDGVRHEFSVSYGHADEHPITDAPLYEVSVVRQGACSGTGVLATPRMVDVPELELVTFSEPAVAQPTLAPRRSWFRRRRPVLPSTLGDKSPAVGREIRERYGQRRDPDAAADALADYWAAEAERRQRV